MHWCQANPSRAQSVREALHALSSLASPLHQPATLARPSLCDCFCHSKSSRQHLFQPHCSWRKVSGLAPNSMFASAYPTKSTAFSGLLLTQAPWQTRNPQPVSTAWLISFAAPTGGSMPTLRHIWMQLACLLARWEKIRLATPSKQLCCTLLPLQERPSPSPF